MISEVRERAEELATEEELPEAELHSVTGGDLSSHHVISNCMRAASDSAELHRFEFEGLNGTVRGRLNSICR